jgi:hypothetical protein
MIKHKAIYATHTDVATIRGDDAFDAQGNPVAYDMAVVQEYIDAHAYIEKRANAYPSIADQLDILYHSGFDTWRTSIQAVKERFPK